MMILRFWNIGFVLFQLNSGYKLNTKTFFSRGALNEKKCTPRVTGRPPLKLLSDNNDMTTSDPHGKLSPIFVSHLQYARHFKKVFVNVIAPFAAVLLLSGEHHANANSLMSSTTFSASAFNLPFSVEKSMGSAVKSIYNTQSKGWELARQKRTTAIKSMEQKGMVLIETDDIGNQFLSLPWIPDRKIPYKSLNVKQRLINEVCAGAFGEISKDLLLHSVDTAKTRRQAQKKLSSNSSAPLVDSITTETSEKSISFGETVKSALLKMKGLYVGFPIVMVTSIPQGGMFFLVKKGMIEFLAVNAPDTPSIVASAIPIGMGVMAYWAFRTPAEVIKTQVQTGQLPTVSAAISAAKTKYSNGLFGLWKHYTVMLGLDIPFQIMNFILYGALSEAVGAAGVAPSVWSRLFCGASCGMVSAAVTCPLDVCKTRIISRDRQQESSAEKAVESKPVDIMESVYIGGNLQQLPESSSTSTTAGSESLHVSTQLSWESFDTLVTATTTTPTVTDSTVLLASRKQLQSQNTDQVTICDASTASIPTINPTTTSNNTTIMKSNNNNNIFVEMLTILREEGFPTLFLGFQQRLLYVGLANGIRLAAYGTSRMDLMMKSLDSI